MLALCTARRALLIGLIVAGIAPPAAAQSYPAQNINFVVAFAAGGIADVVARLVGLKLTERLKQTVVVENRGGAGGNLAAKAVIGAAPDGYTILATTTALAVSETATKNKGFSTDDLRAIAIVALSPDVLAVHPSNPAKDLAEFVRNDYEVVLAGDGRHNDELGKALAALGVSPLPQYAIQPPSTRRLTPDT